MAKKNEYLDEAYNELLQLSADEQKRLEYEAREKALKDYNTQMDYALEQGKTVYAVPGRVGDILSEGCNRLIAQGAGIASSPDMILQELGMGKRMLAENFRQRKVLQLSPEAQYIYGQLDTTPISLEDLCCRVPYDIQQVQGALLELQLEQIVVEISKNYYVKSSKFS